MNIYAYSDLAILKLLGERFRSARLDRNLSQQEVADNAGISRLTVIGIEEGKNVKLMSLIQALRSLGLLDNLDSLIPEPEISPLALAKLKSKKRQRASKTKPLNKDESEW